MSHWEWCVHPKDYFLETKPQLVCRGCKKALAYSYEQLLHYEGGHFHLPCLLDLLPGPGAKQVEFSYSLLDPHFP